VLLDQRVALDFEDFPAVDADTGRALVGEDLKLAPGTGRREASRSSARNLRGTISPIRKGGPGEPLYSDGRRCISPLSMARSQSGVAIALASFIEGVGAQAIGPCSGPGARVRCAARSADSCEEAGALNTYERVVKFFLAFVPHQAVVGIDSTVTMAISERSSDRGLSL
jgi:hypothetical protein